MATNENLRFFKKGRSPVFSVEKFSMDLFEGRSPVFLVSFRKENTANAALKAFDIFNATKNTPLRG